MSSEIDEREYVASLARGLAVIRAFGKGTPEMTLTEVAARTDMTRAAARRFLLTLMALGYVELSGKRFRLTAKILDLGYAYLSSLELPDLAMPFMEDVSAAVHESCSVSVLDGVDIVYVARVPARRIMSVTLNIGTRLPAFATSMGRVLLSALSQEELDAYFAAAKLKPITARTVTDKAELRRRIAEARERGYCVVDQELEEGLCSISVPIRNKSGRVVAAMNVSGHASRGSSAEMVEQFLPVLKRASEGIARSLP